MQSSQQCSLCSRDYQQHELRCSPVGQSERDGYLCQMCWQVLCPGPWPAEESVRGGSAALAAVAAAARGQAPSQATNGVQPMADSGMMSQRSAQVRRSSSLANFHARGGAMAVPAAAAGARGVQWQHPSSMPEQHVVLAGSAEDSRFNLLSAAVAGSAPGRQHPSAMAPPPTFSPVELRHMMDEESLMLFESQSHLLDPESRVALQRQRQYLQWQNSVDEPGPMQSALERQDSAGSGCNQALGAAAAVAQDGSGGAGGGHDSGSAGAGASGHGMARIVEEVRRQLGAAVQERDALAARLQAVEAEVEAHRQATMCKMCRRAPRNCVILPCLHFMSCDDCFKAHCAAAPSCPACHTSVTGFQTLLML